jgi:hypothetical protein
VLFVLAAGSIALAGSTVIEGSVPLGDDNGLKYRSVEFNDADGADYAVATCPGKRVVTGGGAFASGASSEARMIEIGPYAHQDAAASNRRAWTAELVNDAGPAKDLTSYAICAPPRGVKRRTTTRPPQTSPAIVTAKASCPNAASVLGGGISNRAYPGARILATLPFDDGDKGSKPDDGWRVRTFIGDSRELQVFAICKETAGIVYRSKTGSATSSATSTTVTCPNGGSATGGGAALSGNAGFVNSTNPADSTDADGVPDDAWQTFGYAASSYKLTSAIVCKT